MTILGAIVGRNITTEDFKPPSRTNKVPREIPKVVTWYRHPLAQVFMAGFLPFSAIYIELHYIFASIWGHKIYSLFGILFIAFILLVSLRGIAGFYTDYLWFDSLGLGAVWNRVLSTKAALSLAGGVGVSVATLGSSNVRPYSPGPSSSSCGSLR